MQIALNGIDLHYHFHGKGEPLLWLHGGMGCGDDWKFIFREPPPGFLLIAPDLRGHGRSTGDDSPAYSFRQSARDMSALLDALGIETIKIIGLSGGGISALYMATLDPARVAAMVVVSAPAVFPAEARAIARTWSAAALSAADNARMLERHSRPDQLERLFAQTRALADGNEPSLSPEELSRIRARTLIVFGGDDPLYPARLATDLHERIAGSTLWLVEGGGHGPVFGPRAAAFAERTARFLQDA